MEVFADTFLFSAASSVGSKGDLQDEGIRAGSQVAGDTSTKSSTLENVEGGKVSIMETTIPYSSLLHVDASFLSTFIASFFVIICSELGDKTFLITALLAMKEGNALYVFAGSIGALWLMTALSAAGGVVLPALLSPQVTHAIMIVMLCVFGIKMLYEGFTMEDSDTSEELDKLEHELSLKKEETEEEGMELHKQPGAPSSSSTTTSSRSAAGRDHPTETRHGAKKNGGLHSRHPYGNSPGATTEECLDEEGRGEDGDDEEEEEMRALKAEEHEGEMRGLSKGRKARVGGGEETSLKQQPSQQKSGASSSSTDKVDTAKSFCSAFRMPFCRCGHVVSTWLAGVLNPFFLQSFGLTFVAEWGDRSQISTFALAADRSVAGVFVGAALGHASCTFLAVMGGKVLATRISEKMVLISGGIMFLGFGIVGAVLDV